MPRYSLMVDKKDAPTSLAPIAHMGFVTSDTVLKELYVIYSS